MVSVEARAHPGPDELGDVRAFVGGVADATGREPLSDEHALALRYGPVRLAVVARDDTGIVGYGQVVDGNAAQSLDVVVAGSDDPTTATTTPTATTAAIVTSAFDATAGEAPLHWWATAATDDDETVARAAGLMPVRRLHQMTCALPLARHATVATRSFRVGEDETAWLAVNNRAFVRHDEQGGWDERDLAERQAEPWFDPDGFRLHERDDRLAAFCWTKLHQDGDPVEGEIYVIGVDPDFQGLGLGRELTLAGLDSIAERGVSVGMLFVDEDNVGAFTLYRRLGFTVRRTDVAYGRPR